MNHSNEIKADRVSSAASHKTLRLWKKRSDSPQDRFEQSTEYFAVSKIQSLDSTLCSAEQGILLLLSETGELLTWNILSPKEEPEHIQNLFVRDCIVNVIVSKTNNLLSNAVSSNDVAVLTDKGEVYLFRMKTFQGKIETTVPQKVSIPSPDYSNPVLVRQVEFGLLDDLIVVTSMGSVYIYETLNFDEKIQPNQPRELKAVSSKHVMSLYVCSSHSMVSCITKAGEVFTWRKLYYKSNNHGLDREYYGIPKVNKTLMNLKVKDMAYQSDQSTVVCTEDGKVYRAKKRSISLDCKKEDLVITLVQGLEDKYITQVKCDNAQTLALTSSGYIYRWDSTSRPSLLHELIDYNVVDVVTRDAWPSKEFAVLTDSAPSITRAKLDLRASLNKKEQSDVIFMVENQPIYAKVQILVARSEYFRAMFNINMRESRERVVQVPNCSRRLFYKLLEYLHTDVYSLDSENVEDLMDLYEMADMYLLEGLMSLCMVTMEKFEC